MMSGALHPSTARLLSAAVSAVLLATAGTVPASATGAAPDARPGLRHHPHYLRVATWNVGGILTDGRGGTPHERWQTRRSVVVRQLLARSPVGQRGRAPDVIALQEANSERKLPGGRTQYTDLVHLLNVRASGPDHYRALSKALHSKATRIAYNARTVRLLTAGGVRWRAQESKADGPRLMAWARFEHRSTGRRFFFASVHLETASKRVRERQWKELLRVVPRLAHGRPVVVAGDFNSTRSQRGNAAEKFLPRMRKAGFGDALGQYAGGALKARKARAHRLTRAYFNSVNFYRRKLGHSW